ncbi:MAG TPA: pirin family protein, partial [Acidimicrobiia bacterium]|nr:pirin family protein [Acidimicrobiia bacterium]
MSPTPRETTGRSSGHLHGVQLWVAQPSETRDGPPAFEHHPELPRAEIEQCTATVLVGDFAGVTSTARRDTDHVAVQLDLRPGRTALPLTATSEYALVVLEGAVSVGDGTGDGIG